MLFVLEEVLSFVMYWLIVGLNACVKKHVRLLSKCLLNVTFYVHVRLLAYTVRKCGIIEQSVGRVTVRQS